MDCYEMRRFPVMSMAAKKERPQVSVILPACRAEHALKKTMDSILLQDYGEWEMIVICGPDLPAETAGFVEAQSDKEKRIRMVKDQGELGLWESLNVGMRQARGDYIAMITPGSLAAGSRLRRQAAYMDKNPRLGATQTYRHSFGRKGYSICRPPLSSEAMRTKLLFFCDISPSTVMLRRSTVEENQLYFDPQRQCPDWELWFRAAELTDIETIPQALSAEYVPWEWPVVRDDARIQEEMSELAAERLKEGIKLDLLPEKRYLLGGWINVFSSMDPLNREDALWELNEILFEIWKANIFEQFYDCDELARVMADKWHWSKYDRPWQGPGRNLDIGEALELPGSRYWQKDLAHLWQEECVERIRRNIYRYQFRNWPVDLRC
jgi:glycosyltransferase involved in cell wall biosynthesis